MQIGFYCSNFESQLLQIQKLFVTTFVNVSKQPVGSEYQKLNLFVYI